MPQVAEEVRHVVDDLRTGRPVEWLLSRPDVASRLRREPLDRVLVLGCGDGAEIAALATTFPNVTVYGVDDDQDLLDAAVARLRRSRVRDRVLCQWGSAWFPRVAMPFDVVVAVGLLRGDGTDPGGTTDLLESLADVLGVTGLAILDSPHELTLSDVASVGFRAIELLGRSERGCLAYLLRL